MQNTQINTKNCPYVVVAIFANIIHALQEGGRARSTHEHLMDNLHSARMLSEGSPLGMRMRIMPRAMRRRRRTCGSYNDKWYS